MSNPSFDFDVAIVGSRPAGASLAIHLAGLGYSVLLMDKDEFPSVASLSCPVIFASTMELMDDLGVDEEEYSYNTPKIHSFVVGVKDYFNVVYDIPLHKNRDYVYCIDRKRFDYSLLKKAAGQPGITILHNFKITGVLRNGDRITGIIGQFRQGEVRQYTARCIVGADGRFSKIAELVNSPIIKEWKYPSSSILYTYWQNVKPVENGMPAAQLYVPESGLLYMLLDSADNTTGIIIHGQQRKVFGAATTNDSYYAQLKRTSVIWDRLKDAEPLDKLRGIRNIGNVYRKAGGPGWFLTGDALHRRDTLDAQGIYEALLSSRLLSHAIHLVLTESASWEDSINWYERTFYTMTQPMCRATLNRLIWQHRIPWPGWFIRTFIQWLFRDPEYKENFMRLHLRAIDPGDWVDTRLVMHAVWRGFKHDVFRVRR